MPAQTIWTRRKALLRQAVGPLRFMVELLSDERSIKQRHPSVSQLISGNHAEILIQGDASANNVSKGDQNETVGILSRLPSQPPPSLLEPREGQKSHSPW